MPKRDGSPTRGEARLLGINVVIPDSRSRARGAGTEGQFKKWFRNNWPGWIDTYEPTLGTGVGFPDLQIAVDLFLQPIELKQGEVEGDRVFPKEVRGSQIVWHRRFAKHGMSSFILIGTPLPRGRWLAFAVSGERAPDWRKGYAIGTEAILVNNDNDLEFAARLISYTRDYRKGHFR